MPKIKKEEKEKRGVEGYIDNERRVFVITADPDKILTEQEPERTVQEFQDVRELLKKYKPKDI